MTLKPCPEEYGGRCANGTACKSPGGAEAESHQWTYVDKKDKAKGKLCRHCVRTAAPTTSKAAGKRTREEEEDATAGDLLLEILKIYHTRCARLEPRDRARARPRRIECNLKEKRLVVS